MGDHFFLLLRLGGVFVYGPPEHLDDDTSNRLCFSFRNGPRLALALGHINGIDTAFKDMALWLGQDAISYSTM